ncbi:MAG: acyl-CoA thioester hydrolase/BAAT C-terminal domain-containing protein [Novosphingobium sp.]
MLSKASRAAMIAAAVLYSVQLYGQAWVPPIEMADPGNHGYRVNAQEVVANYLPAEGPGRKAAVLLLGGSEGALGSGGLRLATELQAAGFNVLQLSYYRAPGQPASFTRVPLETFDKGIAWLKRQPGVDPRRIGIVGGSKGAEAALIVASRHPEVKAVVAGMPSSHKWAAFSWDGSNVPGASWSLGGKDVTFLPYGEYDQAEGMRSLYANGLKAAAAHPGAEIKIERSPAKVLLVCGQADALWPSCPMSDMLKKRDPRVTILSYADAGHAVFGPPLADDSKSLPLLATLGGSPEGNNAARKDSWPRVIAFLTSVLKGKTASR